FVRRDHVVLFGHAADPAVALDAHSMVLMRAPQRVSGRGGDSSAAHAARSPQWTGPASLRKEARPACVNAAVVRSAKKQSECRRVGACPALPPSAAPPPDTPASQPIPAPP